MKPLFLAAVLLIATAPALAHSRMNALRDVICAYETRGEPDRDAARGRTKDGKPSDEVGRCQLRPGSARQAGYRGTLTDLALPAINRIWALEYLYLCARKLGTYEDERLAHCYNGGPESPWEPYGDARKYAAAIMKLYRLQGGA